ncbi:glycosyltransferase family 2 protein [Candidatus Woesearchaeota archaeon]|nr:glycosyltransferase family 2 protein [Nanoarchaeota archaeon]MCB9370682.1 glycosyltransferase family 2 protein [Candidatus Woesearchaeota archaeon]USN43766.1 MAG: glycosyltransferase family 2 protein [Candidatus Woesearchaeota archaeon]
MTLALDEQIAKLIVWFLYFVGLYFSLFWLSVLLFDPQQKGNSEPTRRKVWPEVTIILPMYNEEKTAEGTLRSVFAADYPKEKLHVIAVPNNCSDGTVKLLRRLQKSLDFEMIILKEGGKHLAMNAGLKRTQSPFFACLDADSFIDKHAIKRLIEEFDSPRIAAVLPIMKVHNPNSVLLRVQWLEYILNFFYKYLMGKLDCIHVTPGPLSMFRTKIVKSLGGFRKAHMTEDLELALRLQDNHYILKQSLEAFVYTKAPNTTKNFISQRTRWYHGTIMNVKDYKHVLFNTDYGDFGMFQMPLVATTGFLLLLGVVTALYLFVKQMYFTFKRWYLTHFDFLTYFSQLHWNKTFLDFDWQVIFTTFVLFGLLFIAIYLAFSSAKERIGVLRNTKYFLMFLYYFIIYKFIMAYVWLKVLYRIVFKKSNQWGKVN